MFLIKIFACLSLVCTCFGGELTISYAPDFVRFGQASTLRLSALDDVIASALGYTAQSSPWTGLTVTSPFKHPKAVVVLGIDGSGSSVLQEGTRYSLQEDQAFLKVYDSLRSTVSTQGFRATHFLQMEVADGATAEDLPVTLSERSTLKPKQEPDASFLLELAALPSLVKKLQEESTVQHGGQDFVFYQLQSFALLVKTYGDGSPQVHEGKQLLREAVNRLVSNLRTAYDNQVLVMTAVLEKPALSLSRKTRDVLYQEVDLNLADEYDPEYPVIFNIILWMSITLALVIVFTALSMAYMDPGRDSIIYRMTNPRMKKDQ